MSLILLKIRNLKNNKRGFTIAETLVAMAVFSVVLVVFTSGVIQITHIYYKGITQSKTQDTTRNVVNDIAQSIEFNGGNITPTSSCYTSGTVSSCGYCVGDQLYSYQLGNEVEDNPVSGQQQTYHGLVVETVPSCSNVTTPQNLNNASVVGNELLSPNTRLAVFSITAVPGSSQNLWSIQIKVMSGQTDLLSATTGINASCIGGYGSQFCSVSALSTIVGMRVQ